MLGNFRCDIKISLRNIYTCITVHFARDYRELLGKTTGKNIGGTLVEVSLDFLYNSIDRLVADFHVRLFIEAARFQLATDR